MYKLRWRKSVSRKSLDRCSRAEQSLRDAILDAMAEVEENLRNEPEFAGESRDEGKRFLIVKPLTITYKLDANTRTVTIIQASVYRSKN
jgi:hypothetical protein